MTAVSPQNAKKTEGISTTKYTNLRERNLKPNAVYFIAGGNIIHRLRVFRPQALKQTAIFTTEISEYTEKYQIGCSGRRR
jgi:hypothetical protein